MMKKSIIITMFICVFYSKTNAQTVYVTENGKKYHAKNCQLAKTGKKGLSLTEALQNGYEACKNCKADKIVISTRKEKVKATADKKK